MCSNQLEQLESTGHGLQHPSSINNLRDASLDDKATKAVTLDPCESGLRGRCRHRLVGTGVGLCVGIVAIGIAASKTTSAALASGPLYSAPVSRTILVPKPPIVWKPVPFGPSRRSETAAYAERHYGIDTWRLKAPKVIVEHYTANTSFSATWNTFASNSPDPALGELPGVCAHFVIDTDGTIYQLVSLNTMCRHTVGLNYTAFGIEHVGESDQQILDNPRQLQASLKLTLWLMSTYDIQLRNVIGHNESVTSPYHHELYAAWRCQTHSDWTLADMDIYRADLARLAKQYGVPMGAPAHPTPSRC